VQLEVPPVLLGYLQESARPASLALYLTLKPRLAAPGEADELRLSGEQEDVARHARKWVPELSGALGGGGLGAAASASANLLITLAALSYAQLKFCIIRIFSEGVQATWPSLMV
jgi:hypothetical protein